MSLLTISLTAAACSGGSPTSPTGATMVSTAPTTATTTTETFSATVGVGSVNPHSFSSAGSGVITMVLTDIAPVSTMRVGLGLGLWDGTTCSVQLYTSGAGINESYQAAVNSAGNYCVSIGDPGTFTDDVSYTIQVTHP